MTGVWNSKKEESEESGNQLITLLGENRHLGASTRGVASPLESLMGSLACISVPLLWFAFEASPPCPAYIPKRFGFQAPTDFSTSPLPLILGKSLHLFVPQFPHL